MTFSYKRGGCLRAFRFHGVSLTGTLENRALKPRRPRVRKVLGKIPSGAAPQTPLKPPQVHAPRLPDPPAGAQPPPGEDEAPRAEAERGARPLPPGRRGLGLAGCLPRSASSSLAPFRPLSAAPALGVGCSRAARS